MSLQELVSSYCPYCGEPVQLLVDQSVTEQEYIEDCQVCCRPMLVSALVQDSGEISVLLRHEDE